MLAIVSVLAISITNVHSASWGYDKPGNNVSHWPELVAECGNDRQSPIDIAAAYQYRKCDEPLELKWISHHEHYAIRNTGYSLLAMPFQIDHNGGADISGLEVMHHANDTNIRLQNSFYHTYEDQVNKEYCFDSLHFHWGKTNKDGSEHTIAGESFPLEVHLVHYSCDYTVAGDALTDYASGKSGLKYDDANVLAVIGVIFEIGAPNPILNKILDDMIIDNIYEKNEESEVGKLVEMYYTDFDVKGLLPQSREIYAYQGSLTTPPCYETVRWHLLKEKMTVSEEQMEAFRSLLSSSDLNDSMAPNFRPPMPSNDRTIYRCVEDVVPDALYDTPDAKDESKAASTNDGLTASELKWKIIGILFICLFVVILCICLCVSFKYFMRSYVEMPSMDKTRSADVIPQLPHAQHHMGSAYSTDVVVRRE